MKGLLTAMILAFVCSQAFSQELSHRVIVSGAGVDYINTGPVFYQHTVGEAMVQLVEADDIILTQGFQQPSIIQKPDVSEESGVRFYPNPVSKENDIRNTLTLELFTGAALPWSYEIVVVNVTGSVVYSEVLDISVDAWSTYSTGSFFFKRLIDMEAYSKGVYIVRVVRSDGDADEARILKM
jgi:hypothetical protein